MFQTEFKYGITLLFSSQVVYCLQSPSTGSFWNADITHTVKVSVSEVPHTHTGLCRRGWCVWNEVPEGCVNSLLTVYPVFCAHSSFQSLFSVNSKTMEETYKDDDNFHPPDKTPNNAASRIHLLVQDHQRVHWSLSTSYFRTLPSHFNYWPSTA